jgi:muramidase (phage lysozyme)
MRKRTMLIVAPLCVVVLAASVAVAAPSSTDQVTDAKLDNPHKVRPIAASPSVLEQKALSAITDQAVAFVRDVQAREIGSFVQDVQATEIHDFLEVVFAAEAAQARPANVRQSGTVAYQDNGDFLSCVRWRESRGDYTVHNSQGSGASGAYQFMPGTWSSIAASEGRGDLVGMDPADAAPADQDAMAAALYAQQGSRPWGGGC